LRTISDLRKFQVEKRGGTPYCTRSYPAGRRRFEELRGVEAGCPPRVPCAEGREENAVVLSCPEANVEGQVNRSQFKRT